MGSNYEVNNVIAKQPKNEGVEEPNVEEPNVEIQETTNDKEDDKSHDKSHDKLDVEEQETTNVLGETENQEKNEDNNSANVVIDISNIEFDDLPDVSNNGELNVESLEETAIEKTDKENNENVVLAEEDHEDINENDVTKDNLNDSKNLQLEENFLENLN